MATLPLGDAKSADTAQRTTAGDRWAVVKAPGTLARGLGAVGVQHTSTSWYTLEFDKNISGCVSLATPGNPGGGIPPKGQVTPGFGATTVTVHTSGSSSQKVDFGFHLLVVCQAQARATAGAGPALSALRTTTSDRWAVMTAAGSLVRGKGVTSQARLGTGAYEVIFDKDVRSCVYVATIGLAVTGIIPPAGEISVAARGNNKNGVYIRTWDSAGASADRPFHLFVGCQAAAARTTDPWAVVNLDGSLALGNRAVASARLGTGAYEVIFDRDVRGCVYVASVARNRKNFAFFIGEVSTAPRGNNKNGVYIRTWYNDGEEYDRPFHLYVGCG